MLKQKNFFVRKNDKNQSFFYTFKKIIHSKENLMNLVLSGILFCLIISSNSCFGMQSNSTPTMYEKIIASIMQNDIAGFEHLLSKGVDPNTIINVIPAYLMHILGYMERPTTLLGLAIFCNKPLIITRLLECPTLNLTLTQGPLSKGLKKKPTIIFSPLHMAAQCNNHETAKRIIDHAQKTGQLSQLINQESEQGNTALMITSNHKIAQLLINAGAKIDHKNNSGQTALQIAQKRNDKNFLQVLTENKPACMPKTKENGITAALFCHSKNPLILSCRNKNTNIQGLRILIS